VAFGGGSYYERPEGWYDCETCDNGEVCEECECHPDRCKCAAANTLAVIKGAPALELPDLAECPDCEGCGRIFG
jgi:hypothetical protein